MRDIPAVEIFGAQEVWSIDETSVKVFGFWEGF